MEPFRGQTKAEVVRSSASTRGSLLEKGGADQTDNNDEDPGNYIRQNDPVPQSATGRILLLSMQSSACSAIIDASLENLSATSDSLAAAVSTFWSVATIDEPVMRQCQLWHQQTTRHHLVFSEQCCSKRERTCIDYISL